MKVIKLATGFAVGYLLGSRAGRQAYERIAAHARQLRDHPTVQQAQEKSKALRSNGTAVATEKLHQTAVDAKAATPTTATVKPRSAPTKVAVAAPVDPAAGQPLI